MKKLIWIFLFSLTLPTQPKAQYIADSLALYYEMNLLKNHFIQLYTTDAMNEMYNFNFDKAHQKYAWLLDKYPEHPLPYFLLGLNESWKMMPNPDDEQYDEKALAYFEQAIEYAYKLQKKDKTQDYQGAFFLAASYAFKARIHADRKNWSRAIGATRQALKYLRYAEKWEELSPEWLLGEGLYNYYSVWIAQEYPLLRPVVAMFKKGKQEVGFLQLHRASEEAFFVRVEAQHFLMRIYHHTEWDKPEKTNHIQKAYIQAQHLNKLFPENAFFQRYFVVCAYNAGAWQEALQVGKEILKKIENKQIGYEALTGRWVSYHMGRIYKSYLDIPEAQRHYEMTIRFGEFIEAYDSGYYQEALFELAKIAESQENPTLAKMYYTRLRKYIKRSSVNFKETKKKAKIYKKKD